MATVKFPYGTFPIDPTFAAWYAEDYRYAIDYPLPDCLPYHHPLLRQISGEYPLPYTLPPWWPTCVEQVDFALLKPLLAATSAQEFRAGCIEQARWKAFRDTLSEAERRALPSSPKLGMLVRGQEWVWSSRFEDRGPTTTPDQLTLTISTQPLDFLYMSNGDSWTSCQHFATGCEKHRLPGNFYDTGVAIATVHLPNKSVRDAGAILTRTTLRILFHEGRPVIALGQTYHNNETLAFLLLHKLAEIFDERHLTWGFIAYVNTLSYCQGGYLGADLLARCDRSVDAESDWFALPERWSMPYVDGEAGWHQSPILVHPAYRSIRLGAGLRLMQPRPSSLPTNSIPARLVSVGMLPCFC